MSTFSLYVVYYQVKNYNSVSLSNFFRLSGVTTPKEKCVNKSATTGSWALISKGES